MKNAISTSFIFCVCTSLCLGQIRLIEKQRVTDSALYFEGKQGKDYQFGSQISPHGDCVDVVNGYIYFAWYKGDITKRNMMLSRRKVAGGEWKTIEFPDKHIGYRGDSTKGDSHNTIAVAVSTLDNTVHLIYDMHAYSKKDFPHHFFNYRVSKINGAFVADEEWNIDLFSERRDYLKQGVDYESYTYPKLFRDAKGGLLFEYRKGGSGHGNTYYAYYGKNLWTPGTELNIGRRPDNKRTAETYSIYGSSKILNGKLHTGFSVRYGDFPTVKYVNNSGTFYAYSPDPFEDRKWFDINDKPVKIPFTSPEPLRIAEPLDLGIGNRMNSGPSWTVTPANDVHFIQKVNSRNVHFYRKSGDNEFKTAYDAPNGDLIPWKKQVYAIGLDNAGKPQFSATPAGENNWKAMYENTDKQEFRHGVSVIDGNKIFYLLMDKGNGSAQPITLLVFEMK